MTELPEDVRQSVSQLLLAAADDKFVLGHHVSDWTGLAPILEADIAFSAIAQEEIAHAQALYEIVAPMLATSADALAFGRDPSAYRCAALVELADGFDWALAVVRQFLCDHFDALRLERFSKSTYQPLAALSARLLREESVHVEHADGWIRALGRGSAESTDRMQKAMDQLAPVASSLFEPVADQGKLEDDGLYPRLDDDMFDRWSSKLTRIATDAGLTLTLTPPAANAVGGRQGQHSQAFTELLDEVCEVYRSDPQAAW